MGRTYYLGQSQTKTGKTRYQFSTRPATNPVEQIPEGYAIQESIHGVVSLVKQRPVLLYEAEINAVNAVLQAHPQGKDYRIQIRVDRIEIYEFSGTNWAEIAAIFSRGGLLSLDSEWQARMQEEGRQKGRFSPVLRFVLEDPQTRLFCVQRMCYRASIDGWLNIGWSSDVAALAARTIPTLGTDAFFELF
jgi:hypothetical protein